MSSSASSTEQKQDSAQGSSNNIELLAKLNALDRVQAVIEFSLNGDILHANDNFLSLFGYSLTELTGKPHRMLCVEEYAKSAQYAELWDALRRGEYRAGQFVRVAKNGSYAGSKQATTRSWTSTASRSRSSNLPPTSQH